MEYITLEDGRISIPFSKSDGKYSFNDSLVMTLEEYQAKTAEQLETMMQSRFNKWVAIITAVPEENVPNE